jgi:hypothetical protein
MLTDGDETRLGAIVLTFRIASQITETVSMPSEGG